MKPIRRLLLLAGFFVHQSTSRLRKPISTKAYSGDMVGIISLHSSHRPRLTEDSEEAEDVRNTCQHFAANYSWMSPGFENHGLHLPLVDRSEGACTPQTINAGMHIGILGCRQVVEHSRAPDIPFHEGQADKSHTLGAFGIPAFPSKYVTSPYICRALHMSPGRPKHRETSSAP